VYSTREVEPETLPRRSRRDEPAPRALLAHAGSNHALAMLARQRQAHDHGCGCPGCAGVARVSALSAGDTSNHVLSTPGQAVLARAPVLCGKCGRAWNDGELQECPHCQSKVRTKLDADASYCPQFGCPLYASPKDEGRFCEDCGERLVSAEDLAGHNEVEQPEHELTKAERRLKNAIDEALSFVSSSGTHHKSTGGKHTKSATEKHSGAHRGKAIERDKKVEELEKLMEAVEQENPSSKLLAKARAAIGSVKSK
jgi:hypothetical protein